MPAYLGLYDPPFAMHANAALWRVLREHALALGLTAPEFLDRDRDYRAIWSDPDLAFAQVCGLPLTTSLLGRVRLLATPIYDFPGCEGAGYRSFVVVREAAAYAGMSDLAGARIAINSPDSHSGATALRHLIAPLANGKPFFAAPVETGAHVESLKAVGTGTADACACDCITWGLIARHQPEALAGLRVLAETATAPAPPFVTGGSASDQDVDGWREALGRAFADPRSAAARAVLGLSGFTVQPLATYDRITEMTAVAMLNSFERPFVKATRKIEWPTVLVAVVVYLGWIALTFFWNRLSPWLILPIGAWLGAWFMSLQHEVMHGHPTSSQRLDDAIGFMPIMLWMPYFRYKNTHLQHHRQEWLTDPLQDPESAYHSPQKWRAMSRPARWLHLASVTLLGRLAVGPFLAIFSFWASEIRLIAAGERGIARIWAGHFAAMAVLLGWLVLVCHASLFSYVLLVVWPATGLSLLRSLVEHKVAAHPQDRTAVVERGGPLALLFLNNNLHLVHHLHPGLPWYDIPATWRRHKARLLRSHHGPVYRSYFEVASLFLTSPHNRGVGTPAIGNTDRRR